MIIDNTQSLNDILFHSGVKGMKWGVRNEHSTSRKTERQAKKDAAEYTKAKMFYGEGAGTRRKLINNTVEARSKNPEYKKAFDSHVANTDFSKRAAQAKSERRRKNVTKTAGKTVRGTKHVLTGNAQYASAGVALTVGGALYAHRKGVDKVIVNSATKSYKRAKAAKEVHEFLRRSGMV